MKQAHVSVNDPPKHSVLDILGRAVKKQQPNRATRRAHGERGIAPYNDLEVGRRASGHKTGEPDWWQALMVQRDRRIMAHENARRAARQQFLYARQMREFIDDQRGKLARVENLVQAQAVVSTREMDRDSYLAMLHGMKKAELQPLMDAAGLKYNTKTTRPQMIAALEAAA